MACNDYIGQERHLSKCRKSISLSSGFAISFTEPVDRRSAANPDSYKITDFTYKYHHIYGSPAVHTQTRTIYKVEVSQNGLEAQLFVEGLRQGYICEIKAEGVRDVSGKHLIHPVGYYTINEIPGQKSEEHSNHVTASTITESIDLKSPKRITSMPSDWTTGPDQSVVIGTLPGMQYDTKEITVKAGSRIKLELNNPDDMMHNLLIVCTKYD